MTGSQDTLAVVQAALKFTTICFISVQQLSRLLMEVLSCNAVILLF